MDEKIRTPPPEYPAEPILRDRTRPRPAKTRSVVGRVVGFLVVIGLLIGA
jgi:hypothetical protein